MKSLVTTMIMSMLTIALAIISASAPAGTSEFSPAGSGWEGFADSAPRGSLAWAGEDESSAVAMLLSVGEVPGGAEDDVRTLTPLPAPEPPAIVLAGFALGGVFCCRSLLGKSRRARGRKRSEDSSAA